MVVGLLNYHTSALCPTPFAFASSLRTFGLVAGENQPVSSRSDCSQWHEQRQLLFKEPQGRYSEIREEMQGLRATLPDFMSSEGHLESQSDDSDEYRNRGSQDESSERASDIQQRKHQIPKKPEAEENDPNGVPETVDSEQAQRQLYPPGKPSTSGNQSVNTSGSRKRGMSIWSHRLRERKYLVAYEEISDPEEED